MAGLNVAADGRHNALLVTRTGADAVRIVLTREHDLRPRLRDYKDHGVFVLGVCARESFDGFGSWGEAFSYYQRRYGEYLGSLQVGNESDLESPSSWTMTPAALSTLGWTARNVMPNMPLVCAGMASGQAWWLGSVDLRWCNAIAAHPYAKDMTANNDLPDADALIAQYRAYGLPVWITEWGWWGDEVRGEHEVRDFVTWAERSGDIERYFHFCIDDGMVAPFGLYRADGSEKPAGRAFREAAGPVAPTGPDLSQWAGTVGQGILDAMKADGTQPAWRASRWPDYGEVIRTTSGETYVWINETQKVYRVPSEAA